MPRQKTEKFPCPTPSCIVFEFSRQEDLDGHLEKGDHYFGEPKRTPPPKPITDPQRTFIKNLLSERKGDPAAEAIRIELNALMADKLLTSDAASKFIDRLQEIKGATRTKPPKQPTIFTLEGR